jgi:NitT/TauT family transport system substrate-binding protein
MKKNMIVCLMSAILLLAGCSSGRAPASDADRASEPQGGAPAEEASAAKPAVRIAALKGPTGMGLSWLMNEDEQGSARLDYEFVIAGSPDEIPGLLTTGEVDIAAVPSNMAALLYNKTDGGVRLLAANTLGVLYILQRGEETIGSVEGLRGRTVVAAGQGATPEYALNYILRAHGLEPGTDVTVDYRSEHAEAATLFLAGEADIVLLPEPQVTSVLLQGEGDARIALDITKEWDEAVASAEEGDGRMIMGCLIANADFVRDNADVLETFLAEYEDSTAFVNANPQEAGEFIEKFGILPGAAAAAQAIPRCNIVYLRGLDMKEAVEGFLNVLYRTDPVSVGGTLPRADFYCE